VLAAAYYIEGAERIGLGVDQAVSHYFETGCMAPPPNWTPTSKPAATTQPATPVTQTQPAKVRSVSEEEREVITWLSGFRLDRYRPNFEAYGCYSMDLVRDLDERDIAVLVKQPKAMAPLHEKLFRRAIKILDTSDSQIEEDDCTKCEHGRNTRGKFEHAKNTTKCEPRKGHVGFAAGSWLKWWTWKNHYEKMGTAIWKQYMSESMPTQCMEYLKKSDGSPGYERCPNGKSNVSLTFGL
jgi:hypothetical protein